MNLPANMNQTPAPKQGNLIILLTVIVLALAAYLGIPFGNTSPQPTEPPAPVVTGTAPATSAQ